MFDHEPRVESRDGNPGYGDWIKLGESMESVLAESSSVNKIPVYRWLIGQKLSGTVLPARLLSAIQAQQERSEVLISIIQLLVLLIFSLLYTLAPKTFSQEATFAPVPWVLSLYLGFSLVRFYLALRRNLPDWFLYLSSVVDIVLLYGLIWSFHLQYEQAPSFYLKTPTLLYLFIFIAIRALHFDPRFVISTGLTAALGWILMVIYALYAEPGGHQLTRDYVEYMTSNSVLIGAEFDKVVTILIVTGVLALVLARARSLLLESVIEGSAARDLSRFVPDEVVAQVTRSEEGATTGQGEVGECTILFTDIEKFTSISERLDPAQLIEALNRYFHLIAAPIEQYGGVISQFQGDTLLATFNLPRSDAAHASNAIRAALAMQATIDGVEFGDGIVFKTRIGINTGTVIGGLVGSGDRVSYTVHGDAVNLAARLEQLNKDYPTQSGIIVAEETLKQVPAEDISRDELGEVIVRGRHRPVRIYTVDQR